MHCGVGMLNTGLKGFYFFWAHLSPPITLLLNEGSEKTKMKKLQTLRKIYAWQTRVQTYRICKSGRHLWSFAKELVEVLPLVLAGHCLGASSKLFRAKYLTILGSYRCFDHWRLSLFLIQYLKVGWVEFQLYTLATVTLVRLKIWSHCLQNQTSDQSCPCEYVS